MNVYVVTLYNSTNCGAYLQAWALGKMLASKTNKEPIYINTGARFTKKEIIKLYANAMRYRDFKRIAFGKERFEKYRSDLRLFPSCGLEEEFKNDDLIFFGSDEILNISRRNIASFPALWGEGIHGGNKVAYAPSANGAELERYKKRDCMAKSLTSFKALSARDADTARRLENITGLEVPVVCDPTLLLKPDDYLSIEKKSTVDKRYLLVYSYGLRMSKENIDEIRGYAKRRNLKIISADRRIVWCDESIPCGPREFLSLLRQADSVVTDTFHGMMLSTLFQKNYAVYARNTQKILDAIEKLGLQSFNASQIPLNSCLSSEKDWDTVNDDIEKFRVSSIGFIEASIEPCLPMK